MLETLIYYIILNTFKSISVSRIKQDFGLSNIRGPDHFDSIKQFKLYYNKL